MDEAMIPHPNLTDWNRRYADPTGRPIAANVKAEPEHTGSELVVLRREIYAAFGCAHALATAVETLAGLLFADAVRNEIAEVSNPGNGVIGSMTEESRALVRRTEAALYEVERIAQQFA